MRYVMLVGSFFMTSLHVIDRAVNKRNCSPPSDQSESLSQQGLGTTLFMAPQYSPRAISVIEVP